MRFAGFLEGIPRMDLDTKEIREKHLYVESTCGSLKNILQLCNYVKLLLIKHNITC